MMKGREITEGRDEEMEERYGETDFDLSQLYG